MATWSSKQYSWCDLSVAIGGRILEGITELEYTEKQEKALLRGRGCKPHKVLRGNKEYEGRIKIWQSELEAMTRDAPNNDILALSFEVIATYVPKDGGQMVTDVLVEAEFTEVAKSLAQGATNMEVELPLIFIDVKRQQ
ncbi:Uncharacterised protein [Weeksella virosa]|uniref:Phage tail protein n=2 Tax=Weeksella virosa TaxID=1014 RepID=F0P2U7_WEEVC|nr:hypothetical protein [Weeksella virosa]ADX66837.1 hypothetical protein Weevi_0111 [Weeksella virosa DSM 16922]VEH63439.1 Uncharacterised protein [Weeksella virosa]